MPECSECGRKIVYEWDRLSATATPNGIVILRFALGVDSGTFWLCDEHKELHAA